MDALTVNYAALAIAIDYYKEITPEQAFRLAEGKSRLLPQGKLTKNDVKQISKVIASPGFKGWQSLERRYRVSRYQMWNELEKIG